MAPKRLQERFRGRRFLPAEPDLLDYPGAEIMLIGATEEAESELGIRLDTDDEEATSADIFRDLKLKRTEAPTRPLFEGEWR